MDKILISERVYNTAKDDLKEFLKNEFTLDGYANGNLLAHTGLLIAKNNIVSDIIFIPSVVGCRQMVDIRSSSLTRVVIEAYKLKCIPVGIIRIGLLSPWGMLTESGHGEFGKGDGIFDLSRISKDAFMVSVFPKSWYKYLLDRSKYDSRYKNAIKEAIKTDEICFVIERCKEKAFGFENLEYELRKEERKGEK